MIRELKNVYHLASAILANIWYGFPGRSLTVIGVTGTDGKTTTTTLIYDILRAAGKKVSMISTVHAVVGGTSYDTGFHVTSPDSWELQKFLRQAVDAGEKYMVLEVTSHGIDQHRIWGIPFTIAVITNITHEHLDWHGTFEHYLQTKTKFACSAGCVVINRDDRRSYERIKKVAAASKKILSYGLRKNADVNPILYPFKTSLPGDYNKQNILAALAVGHLLALDKNTLLDVVASFRGIVGRMEVIQEKPFRVIVDFAHTPNALHQVLSTVKKTTKGRLVHVFGCAGLRDHTKREKMGKESDMYSDITILTEEDTRTEDIHTIWKEIGKGLKKEVKTFENRRDALFYAVSIAKPGDTIVATGKGHEKSLCRGTTEYPWSDQEVLRSTLNQLHV